ncbi:MAG: LacI family transcriptional regulator [Clostridiaceae bacterium]|nr:LacI family transcriptional regulator [Clostridiaceae bacterium]
MGVIVPEISSNYYATMLDCIEKELNEKDYSLIVGMAHHDYQKEIHYLKVFSNRRVDGIILAGSMYSEINKTLDKIRKRNNIPIVLIHSFISYEDYDYIFVDDIYGINAAMEYLKELGHRNIGYIADELASRFRIEKIKESISKNGLNLNKEHIKIGKVGFEAGGYQLMQELLNEKKYRLLFWLRMIILQLAQ